MVVTFAVFARFHFTASSQTPERQPVLKKLDALFGTHTPKESIFSPSLYIHLASAKEKYCIDIQMYGIIVFCLSFISMAFGSNNTTTKSKLGRSSNRDAKDGVYIGCYSLNCLEFDFHPFPSNMSNLPTPDSCTALCEEKGFPIAALYNQTECSCSCEYTCFTKPLGDTYCGLPCRGDLTRFCGGFEAGSLFAVNFDDESKTKCMGIGNENVNDETDASSNGMMNGTTKSYIAAGMGAALFILLIISVGCFRRRDRPVVSSPHDHSCSQGRAHTDSQQNEERPPNKARTTSIDPPPLPVRHSENTLSDVNSTSCNKSSGLAEPLTKHAKGDLNDVPVLESNFYHVLMPDGEQSSSRRCSVSTDNTYAFLDCPSYMDSFPRSAAMEHRQADSPRYPEDDDEVELNMVNNELYAVAGK